MFTTDNTIDSTPEQLEKLNAELKLLLKDIDPNDYELRSEVEEKFRQVVSDRGIAPIDKSLTGALLAEHVESDEDERDPKARAAEIVDQSEATKMEEASRPDPVKDIPPRPDPAHDVKTGRLTENTRAPEIEPKHTP